METNLKCKQCHSQLEQGMKFCVYCGAKVEAPVLPPPIEKHSDIEVVRNKAQWKIQPGVVAQRISPSDFENLDNVTGINIQQGVTAYVYVDGKQVAQLNGGAYDFINQNDINNLLGEKASIGLVGHVKKVFNSLVKAITGKKVSEVIDENSRDYSMLKTYDDVLRTLQPKSNIEVYLKSDSPFSVIFGSKTDSYGNVSFSPMQVLCKHLSADIAVSLQMKIVDFSAFISAFLVDKCVVTCCDLEQYMAPYVKAILMNKLRDVEIDEYGIPQSIVSEIQAMLSLHLSVPGSMVTMVRDITTSNSDFARLRTVADRLYLSEKELMFAIRSNDFRNRLMGVENSQKIAEAKTALDLHKALSEINKDQALHDDELDEFYMLLSRQKKIREATNDQEVRSALEDIAKLDLLKEDEMDALNVELLTKKIDRASIAEIMTMQSMANVEMKRVQIEETLANTRHSLNKVNQSNAHDLRKSAAINDMEIEDLTRYHTAKNTIKDAETETDVLKIKLEQQRISDEYSDERFATELNKYKTKEEIALELEEKKRRLEAEEMERLNRQNMEIFTLWANEDEKKAKNEHTWKIEEKVIDQKHEQTMAQTMTAHEEAMRAKDIESRKVSATMTAEQLMAEQAAKLDAEAQRKMAESLGSAKVSEVESRMRAELLEEARKREEQLKREAAEREERLRRDQMNFFGQLSSDRDALLNGMKEMMGMVAGVKNKADEYSMENRNLNSRIAYGERQVSYKEEEVRRMEERLRHEQERNDNTYNRVLDHEEKLQNTAVDAIRAASVRSQSQSQPQPTVICPNCGKQVMKWKFCKECGCELDLKK